MIRSMTGYGRGEAETSAGRWVAEIKSVNHRFLDIKTKLPSELFGSDIEIQRRIQSRCSRGRFEVLVILERHDAKLPIINKAVLEGYLRQLRHLQTELQLDGRLTLETLLALPEVVQEVQPSTLVDGQQAALAALDRALESLHAMREREGQAMYEDLKTRITKVLNLCTAVEQKVPLLNALLRERLLARLRELSQGVALDPQRVEQEAAILVERSDVTEELVRLGIHARQFLAFLEEHEPVGRKMDFLIQEMNREVNTLGAKVADAEVAQSVVGLKSELEKIREQVQNVE